MNIDQMMVLGVFVGTVASLIFSNQKPSLIFAVSTFLLLISQLVTMEQVLSNLSNKGLVVLILLLMVSLAVDKSSVMKKAARRLIVANQRLSTIRIVFLSFFSSAILNNTAVVSTLIGPIKSNRLMAPSKLLIPLSYAAILGGTVTLIGTSTNLIVDSFLIDQGHSGFKFWDFALYGISAGLICCAVIILLQPLLPEFQPKVNDYKNYIIEAKVENDSPLIGKTIEANHLRNLPELFLVEVVRKRKLISPVNPELVIQAGDKLIFSGNIERVDTLDHIPGLSFFADSNGLLRENLTEVIVSNRAQIIGKTLKSTGFRALFDAAVMGIRRDGEKLSGKLGEIKLKAGDFLLLATGPDFKTRPGIKSNFFVLSDLKIEKKLNPIQNLLSIFGFLSVVLCAALEIIGLDMGLMFLLMLLVISGAISTVELKRNLPLNLMMVIVGALSLSKALEQTGLINALTGFLEPWLVSGSPFMALVGIYICTLLLTELVTNNAAAALMFPFALGISQAMGLDIMPFALAVAFAASASFVSPWGYQTNLLVFSAGGYRFHHFVRIGLVVSLIYSAVILTLLKWQYGF